MTIGRKCGGAAAVGVPDRIDRDWRARRHADGVAGSGCAAEAPQEASHRAVSGVRWAVQAESRQPVTVDELVARVEAEGLPVTGR